MGLARGAAARDRQDASTVESHREAARLLRRLGMPLGADAGAVLALAGSGGRTRLMPILDCAYPDVAAPTTALVERGAAAICGHALRSSAPCVWTRSAQADPTSRMWSGIATRIEPPVADFDGIAFPVYGENGRQAVAVFTGDRLTLSNLVVCDTHLAVARLFHDVCRLRMGPARAVPVSKRELECLRLVARGLTSDEIAAELKLSVHTANQYLSNTTQKLDAVNRMHAVAKAMRLGLID